MKLKKSEATLARYYAIEEEFWKQKSELKWFRDVDNNTKFFHSFVKGQRRKLHIEGIENSQSEVVESYANWACGSSIFPGSIHRATSA